MHWSELSESQQSHSAGKELILIAIQLDAAQAHG